jgi:cysteine synthase
MASLSNTLMFPLNLVSSDGLVSLLTADTTLDPVPQHVVADATSGPVTITLPPFALWLGYSILITKLDATANPVTWQTSSSGDVVVGVGTSGTLTAQGQSVIITAIEA